MNSERAPHDYVVAATNLLDHARAEHNVELAIQALAQVGRGAAAGGWNLDAPSLVGFREELLALSAEPEATHLFAWAVLTVTNSIYGDSRSAFIDSLFARSGFQVLLDLPAWDECPVDRGHLHDVDEGLAEAVGEGKLQPSDRPESVPSSHSWWFPPPAP